MTYTYRLSRRLAVLRPCALLGLLTAMLACQDQDIGGPDATGPSLASRWSSDRATPRISPESLSASVGVPVQFQAYALNSRGDSSLVQVVWTASGGRITTTGLFSADAVGRFDVVASRSWKGRVLSDTAQVDVSGTSANPIRLIVSPDTATVNPGKTRQFSAIAKMSDSTAAALKVLWTATGGRIDSTGVFRADSISGHFEVRASLPTTSLIDSAAVTVASSSSPTLDRIVLVPGTLQMGSGESIQFIVYGLMSNGDSVAVPASYTASGGSITSAGQYTAGLKGGTYSVVAVQQGGTLADTASVTVVAATPTVGKTVGLSGVASGDCTATPCSLLYALAGAGGTIQPTDTVWVRGGAYRLGFPTISGLRATLIGYPGERAVIDGALRTSGSDLVLQDLEFANTDASHNDLMTLDIHGPRTRLSGLVVHDAQGNGIGVWSDAANSIVENCVIYNNGWNAVGGAPGHGIYAQSASPNTVTIRDNAIFDGFGWGIHAYAEGGPLSGYLIEGNVLWNNGWPANTVRSSILIGGYPAQASRVTVRQNATYVSPNAPNSSGSRERRVRLGKPECRPQAGGQCLHGARLPLTHQQVDDGDSAA